jgi:alkylated DNA repair dioxygenase AlkB
MTARVLSLFGSGPPRVSPRPEFVRHQLDPCCWVDYGHGFLTGGDTLFDRMVAELPWDQGRRLMYGTWHDEPRLTARLDLDDAAVPPVVDEAVAVLSERYRRRFHGLFCNYYRGPDDGVAWHADRIGRQAVDPLVAIISLGGPRRFVMRSMKADDAGTDAQPGPARASVRWLMHSGDLLVMGGATQHHWEHAVPKVKRAPARISLTTRAGFDRDRGVEPDAGGPDSDTAVGVGQVG